MYSLDSFLAEQACLEARFAEFFASLDVRRTATLRELLLDETATARLEAPWLNRERLKERLNAMCRFFDRVDPPSRSSGEKRPLFFFQSNCEKEDEKTHAHFHPHGALFEEYYLARVGDAPPQHHYLHTNPCWTDVMMGSWESGNRVIHPLFGFVSDEWPTVLRQDPGESVRTAIIGLRILDLPKWLGVSGEIATDYLARMIIHDIGHMRLPPIKQEADSLHNVTMLHAVGGARHKPTESAWEEIVHRECTDPYFFIDGAPLLRAFTESGLTPLKRYLLKRYKAWYASTAHDARNQQLWEIEREWSPTAKRAAAARVLAEMCADGFTRYPSPYAKT